MKNLKNFKTISIFAFSLFISSISLMSCSKNDEPTAVTPVTPITPLAPEQDPLNGYLIASGFNQVTSSFVNNSDRELGYSFIPLVNGKITAIVVKIPDTRSALRVTIWDKVTGGALRTESINVTTADTEVTKTIAPLELIKDKEYVISMNTNDLYVHKKTDSSNALYPFEVGDIKITSFVIGSSTLQVIPNLIINYQYVGDCSFKFQK